MTLAYTDPHKTPTDRRIALLVVAPEMILSILLDIKKGRKLHVFGLADDVECLGANWDFSRQAFILTLESKEFSPVRHGAYAPFVDVTISVDAPVVEFSQTQEAPTYDAPTDSWIFRGPVRLDEVYHGDIVHTPAGTWIYQHHGNWSLTSRRTP